MNKAESNSYVVVDARSMTVYAGPPPFDGIIAVDLPDDLWRDFQFFAEEARSAELAGNAEMRCRFLRAALFCLFAHFNAFFDLLIGTWKRDSAFQAFRAEELPTRKAAKDFPRCEHGQFIVLLTEFMAKKGSHTLPVVDLSVKLLRNILAHPVSRKTDVTVADLYNLDIAELNSSARSVEAWLDAVCGCCGIQRRIDTAKLATELWREATGKNIAVVPF